MLVRDDLLRLARIIDYDRFFIPSKEMMNDPSFEYEYVQVASHKKLDTYGYCIQWQMWKKAKRHSAFDPCITETEMTKKIQNNEVRAKKEMKTSELRTILETLPLQFTFEDGIKVVVLPKLTSGPHKVYVRWSVDRDLYCEQYSLDWQSDLHKKWFNSEKAKTTLGQDWRYLLGLNFPEVGDGTNELYKVFDGVYTGEVEFRLEKGTEIYTSEKFPDGPPTVDENLELFDKRMRERVEEYSNSPATKSIEKRIKDKPTFKLCCNEEGQKMVCIKDPKTGNIVRINKHFTGKFLKNGFTFVSKEEYKLQQKLNYEKRKDMAEGNYEAQLLKYKGPKTPKKPKGIEGSPFTQFQTIEKRTFDKKDPNLIAQETIKVKHIVPQYEYKPVVWEIWEEDSKGKKIKLLETIPFLNEKGEPRKRKHFIGNKEVWETVVRDVPVERRTIKVLQIPSKKTKELKSAMAQVNFSRLPEGSTLLLRTIKSQRTKHLLGEDKDGNTRLDKVYLEKEQVKRPVYETYFVTKRDGFGQVVNIAKRKLAK